MIVHHLHVRALEKKRKRWYNIFHKADDPAVAYRPVLLLASHTHRHYVALVFKHSPLTG